jgi:hypothetical protein
LRRGVHRPCGRGTVRHVVPRRWMDAHPCMRWPWWRARAAMDDMGPQRLLHCAARRAAARGERHAGSARPRKLPFRKLPFRKLPFRKLPFRKLLSGNFHSGACDVEIFRQARRAQSSLLGPALAQRSWPLRCTSALTSSRRSPSRRSPGRHQSCTFGRHGAAQALFPVHDRVDGHMRTVLCWAGPGL